MSSSEPPRWLKPVLFVLCFGSIWTLLGFLYGLAPMHVLGSLLLLPTMSAVGIAWWFAWQKGWEELHLSLLVGFWGGVWGTLGYDMIRIPLHVLGLNPFAPIRSYGMFLTDAPAATLASDWAGVTYHFSNGISFGWMYALVMLRRHWAWGVLWGMVLETLAFGTIYGHVYGVRYDVVIIGIAYFAHLYYGLPLGWAVQRADRVPKYIRVPSVWRSTGIGVIFVMGILALAWERPWQGPDLPKGTVQVGPDAIYPGWARADGEPIVVVNGAEWPIVVEVPGSLDPTELSGGERLELELEPGLRQIRCPEERWRSAFLSIERDGYPR